ncbi:MAG: NAD(P)H-dependent oxidoreductase subunit E [Betaproteobacteria bacterium]
MTTDKVAAAALEETLARYGAQRTDLVQILIEAQEPAGWLPPATITRIAQAVGWPRARVEGVASFYAFLHLAPAGRYRVRFSDNITDRMAGNLALLDRMCSQLWIERGKVSEDHLVSVDLTSCTGMCDQGPALIVNGWAIPKLNEARIDEIAALICEQVPIANWPRALFVVADNVRRRGSLLDEGFVPGSAIRAVLERQRAAGAYVAAQGFTAMIEEMKRAKLRGRGGAGYAVGFKWEGCRVAPDAHRLIVCNADEGEPCTFKDRVLLNSHADLVFDGMPVAAYACGACEGRVYLRGEYRHLLAPLRAVLARRRAAGLLGRAICGEAGFDFDIEVHLGAGAYVCGEASALVESLEGKRGVPSNRPPHLVEHGYLGHPTAVNNVETLAAAALIAIHGGDWYASVGTLQSAGTKLLSVSGDCAAPGIYEVPLGTPVEQVLADCGARDTQAVQIGGPSGTCIGADEFGRRIAFEDLPTPGALTVFDQSRDMFEVALNFTRFFAHESCGFCTPCRVGTSLLERLMGKIAAGRAGRFDLERVNELNALLKAASHCELGASACNPVVDTLKCFRPAYERRLLPGGFEPIFDLDRELAPARAITGRDDADAHLVEQP